MNLGRPVCFLKRLFSDSFAFFYSAKHNTRSRRKFLKFLFFWQIFGNNFFEFVARKNSLAGQRGQRQGSDEMFLFDFFSQFFDDFFTFFGCFFSWIFSS